MYINYILEDESVKQLISSNENIIGYMVQNFPVLADTVIERVKKNSEKFIISDDLKKTKNNIVYYAESIFINYLYDCSSILELNISDNDKLNLINEIFTNNIILNTKLGLQEIGNTLVNSLNNPMTISAMRLHLITFLGGGLIKSISSGEFSLITILLGGQVGEIWVKILSFLGITGIHNTIYLMSSVSALILVSIMIYFLVMKLVTKSDIISVYFLNSNLKELLNKLTLVGFDKELKNIKLESNIIKGFQVEKFKECEENSNCSKIGEDKNCLLNCFFNFFIEKELKPIINVYFMYLKKLNIDTSNIKSSNQLFNIPLPSNELHIQESASNFSNSLFKVLQNLYKEDINIQLDWNKKINKIVENRSIMKDVLNG